MLKLLKEELFLCEFFNYVCCFYLILCLFCELILNRYKYVNVRIIVFMCDNVSYDW